jgi:hypothetical protein
MNVKLISAAIMLLLTATLIGCNGDKTQTQAIFPKGEPGPATNFTGNAYNFGLVANDSTYNTLVGNVYFENAHDQTGMYIQVGRS